MTQTIDFLLFDGFSNMVLASALEPLRAANMLSGRELYRWRLVTLDGAVARSSSGMSLLPAEPAVLAEPRDVLFVVVGYGTRRFASTETRRRLRRIARTAAAIGGLDAGAWLLADAGLLDGRQATIHWQELTEFAETFPDLQVAKTRFVIDGKTVTAGGANTVMDLAIRMIRDRHGDALAFDVGNLFAYDGEARRPDSDAVSLQSKPRRAPQLLRAVEVMRANLEAPLSLERVAKAASCSSRSLNRLFLRELGVSPGRYYLSIRLAVARQFAEETRLSGAEIAARTGFGSGAALSRAFSGHFKTTIRDLRALRG